MLIWSVEMLTNGGMTLSYLRVVSASWQSFGGDKLEHLRKPGESLGDDHEGKGSRNVTKLVTDIQNQDSVNRGYSTFGSRGE